MPYSKIRQDLLRRKVSYSDETLHNESNNCFCQLDLVWGSICESHAKNRTQIWHFSWIFGPSQNLMKIEIFERIGERMRECETSFALQCHLFLQIFVKFD